MEENKQEDRTALNILIPAELMKLVKAKAAMEGVYMRDFVEATLYKAVN